MLTASYKYSAIPQQETDSAENNLSVPAQPVAKPISEDTCRQLHNKMLQGGEWWKDGAFCQMLDDALQHEGFRDELEKQGLPLPDGARHLTRFQAEARLKPFIFSRLPQAVAKNEAIKLDFYAPSKQSLTDVAKSCLQQAVLKILFESALKLTGMSKPVAQAFLPVIDLMKGIQTILSSGKGNLVDSLQALTLELNNARSSLKSIDKNSAVFYAVDNLCDVADVLHKGLAASDLNELKNGIEKLEKIPLLAPIVQVAKPLMKVGEWLQQVCNVQLTGPELARSLVKNVLPENLTDLMVPLQIAKKISAALEAKKIQVDGLSPLPEKPDTVTTLRWLMNALLNDSLRGMLASADREWLMETLEIDAKEADYIHTNLLPTARALASFPADGAPLEQLIALKTLPGLSDMYSRAAGINVKEHLGPVSSLLKNGTTVTQLGDMATAPGLSQKVAQALQMLDTDAPMAALKTLANISYQAFLKTCGVATDAARAIWLVLKKGYDFHQSGYSQGQSLKDPVRLYRDVMTFIQQDIKANPDDYKNATAETLLATVAVVFKSLGGNHVPINWKGNTAEWLNAYAQADPEKLTVIDQLLMHAVLEPRVILEIKRAIQEKDPIQARKLIEPLSEALKSYVGESPFLRSVADALQYIPPLSAAWREIQAMEVRERKVLGEELRQQSSLLQDTLRNSLKKVSPETLQERQKTLLNLQEKLTVLQGKCGQTPGKIDLLEAELQAMQTAVAALPERKRAMLEEELALAQTALDKIKKPDMAEELSEEVLAQKFDRQAHLHQSVRQVLDETGVSHASVMLAQLEGMSRTLQDLPVELRLTDLASVSGLAGEALLRLITSQDGNLQALRAELGTRFINSASDGLTDLIRWSGKQMMKPFTKEVELTPEEKLLGLFVIERDVTAGQLIKGAAAGAASGALLSALFLLLSDKVLPNLKSSGITARPLNLKMTDANGESINLDSRPGTRPEVGGIYGHTTEPLVREGISLKSIMPERKNTGITTRPLHLMQTNNLGVEEKIEHRFRQTPCEIYGATTDPISTVPVNRDSLDLKKVLMLAVPVIAGAAAGAGIAAAMNPAIRERHTEDEIPDERNPALTGYGRLHTFKREDGVTLGINLLPGQTVSHYRDNQGQMRTIVLEEGERHPMLTPLKADESRLPLLDTEKPKRAGRQRRDYNFTEERKIVIKAEKVQELMRLYKVEIKMDTMENCRAAITHLNLVIDKIYEALALRFDSEYRKHLHTQLLDFKEKLQLARKTETELLEVARNSLSEETVMSCVESSLGILQQAIEARFGPKMDATVFRIDYANKLRNERPAIKAAFPTADSTILVCRDAFTTVGKYYTLLDLLDRKHYVDGSAGDVRWTDDPNYPNDSRVYMPHDDQQAIDATNTLKETGMLALFKEQFRNLRNDANHINNVNKYYEISVQTAKEELITEPLVHLHMKALIKGGAVPTAVKFHNKPLLDVGAYRIGNSVLLFNMKGEWITFADSDIDPIDSNAIKWVTRHLPLADQEKAKKNKSGYSLDLNINESETRSGAISRSPFEFLNPANRYQDWFAAAEKHMLLNLDHMTLSKMELVEDGIVKMIDKMATIAMMITPQGRALTLITDIIAPLLELAYKMLTTNSAEKRREIVKDFIGTFILNLAVQVGGAMITLGPKWKDRLMKGDLAERVTIPWSSQTLEDIESLKEKIRIVNEYAEKANKLRKSSGTGGGFKKGYESVNDHKVLRSDIKQLIPAAESEDLYKTMVRFTKNTKPELSTEQLGALKKYLEYRHAKQLEDSLSALAAKYDNKKYKTIISSTDLPQGPLFISLQRFGVENGGRCLPLTLIYEASRASGRTDDFIRNMKFLASSDDAAKVKSYVAKVDSLHGASYGDYRYKLGFQKETPHGVVVTEQFSPSELVDTIITEEKNLKLPGEAKFFQIITEPFPQPGHAMSAGVQNINGKIQYHFYDPNTRETVFSNREGFRNYLENYLKDEKVLDATKANINGRAEYKLWGVDMKRMYEDYKFGLRQTNQTALSSLLDPL